MTTDPVGSDADTTSEGRAQAPVSEEAPDSAAAAGDDAAASAQDAPNTAEGSAAESDPAEDMKAKFREALAHKHGSHGATHTEHGDRGAATHGPEPAHGHRMFRRKSG